MSNVKFKIDSAGLLNGMKQYRSKLKSALDNTISYLAVVGRDYAKQNLLVAYHTQKEGDTLADNIISIHKGVQSHKYYRSEIWATYSNLQEDILKTYYLEYGAGNVQTRHPYAVSIGWVYDLTGASTRTANGWYYYTLPYDKNPNKFELKRSPTGYIAYTKSSEPTMFMYNTRKYLERVMDGSNIKKLIK